MRRPGKTLCPPSSFGLAVVVVVVVVVLISCRCLALSFSLLLLLLLLLRRRPRPRRLPRGDVLVSERPAPKVSYAFHMR